MKKMANLLGFAEASSYQYYEKGYKKDYFESTLIRQLLKALVPLGIDENRIVLLGGVKNNDAARTLSDAEIALTDALKVIMQVLLHNGLASQRAFSNAFSQQEADYQEKGLPNAVLVMQELIGFVNGDPLNPDSGGPSREALQKLLRLPQIGRA